MGLSVAPMLSEQCRLLTAPIGSPRSRNKQIQNSTIESGTNKKRVPAGEPPSKLILWHSYLTFLVSSMSEHIFECTQYTHPN